MSSAQDGQGTTVSFGTSGFSADLISVSGPALSRAAIDSTSLSSTVAREKIPAELYDGGQLELTVEHDGSDDPPITGSAETITVNWGGTGNNWSFSGFCTAYNPTASIGERMQATMTVTVTGSVTF